MGQEFDLNHLATSLPGNVRYEPEIHPGLYLRTGEREPLIIIYRTGKFIVTGARSEEDAHSAKENAIETLSEVTQQSLELIEFNLCNYVLSGDLGTELDLNAISIGLGLERTEYNPDTLAAVLYTPEEASCTIMIFKSGKVNIVGEDSRIRSEKAFQELDRKIGSLLAEE